MVGLCGCYRLLYRRFALGAEDYLVEAGDVDLGLGTCVVDVVAYWAVWGCAVAAASSACLVAVGMPCWVGGLITRLFFV